MQKYPDEMQDKSSDAGSEMGDSGVPEFQGLLLSFLDNQAPYLGNPHNHSKSRKFLCSFCVFTFQFLICLYYFFTHFLPKTNLYYEKTVK